MTTIAFFNNKGGVGKTSLVYHLSWMFSELGKSVLAIDLDPQANLTSMFIDESRLESLWPMDAAHEETIMGALTKQIEGTGDITAAKVQEVAPNLNLIAGDLALSKFEDSLSASWPACLSGAQPAFRVTTAFARIIEKASVLTESQYVFVDVGPNLGAINRAALIACDYVVVPLAPDLFSIQGLRNLGPTLKSWRKEWKKRRGEAPSDLRIPLPAGRMAPLGYVVMQYAAKQSDKPVKAYTKWMTRIPSEYAMCVKDSQEAAASDPSADSNCLAQLKHYRSLVPMAMEARKPIFNLKSRDGALGAHLYAVESAREDFRKLAKNIVQRIKLFEASGA